MKTQINRYRKEGYPDHNGLVAGGFVVRDNRSNNVKLLMKAWWREIARWSRRDQLIFNMFYGN